MPRPSGHDQIGESLCANSLATQPGIHYQKTYAFHVEALHPQTPDAVCDSHSPWQPCVNDIINGLLRQYFPKGTDLSIHSAEDLDWVAQELNDRPRKRLEFSKPIEEIEKLLLR